MSRTPLWVGVATVRAIQAALVAEHGGLVGEPDANKLESALARAPNRFAYGDPSPTLGVLAAEYAFGLARNHPFPDGNKRVALMAAYAFLQINGARLVATELDAVATFRALAAGEVTLEELTAWFAANTAIPKRRR